MTIIISSWHIAKDDTAHASMFTPSSSATHVTGHGAGQDPAFRALALEKRVGWATALGEDIPQAVLSVVAAVYLQEVTPDMVRFSQQ